jgi:hypothetical protein
LRRADKVLDGPPCTTYHQARLDSRSENGTVKKLLGELLDVFGRDCGSLFLQRVEALVRAPDATACELEKLAPDGEASRLVELGVLDACIPALAIPSRCGVKRGKQIEKRERNASSKVLMRFVVRKRTPRWYSKRRSATDTSALRSSWNGN